MTTQENSPNVTRRRLLQVSAVGVGVGLSGCMGVFEEDQPECTDSNAVLYFPHNLFVVTVTGDGASNAEQLRIHLVEEDYYAETRPTVDFDISDQEVEQGDGVYLVIIGDFEEADIEDYLDEFDVDHSEIRFMDGIMQRLIEDFPNYLEDDVLTQRFEYVTEDLSVQAGLELPELNKAGEYIEIENPESDDQVSEIKQVFEPRGRVEMKLSSQELGDGVSTFNDSGETDLMPIGFGPLSSDDWRVDKSSVSIVQTDEDDRVVVFQMDDDGSDYAAMLNEAENPESEEVEVYIDDELLYSRPLTPSEQSPPESGITGGGEFGAIQMVDMTTLEASRLATALSHPAQTPYPGTRVC